jgi:hypothetical protein
MCCAVHSKTAVVCRGNCFRTQPAPGGGFEVVLTPGPHSLYSFVAHFDKREIAEAFTLILNEMDAVRLLSIAVDVVALRDREVTLLANRFSDPYYDE